MATLHEFTSNAELINCLGDEITEKLRQAIAKKGTATIAVSGGSSPIPLFEYLSVQALDWSKITVTLVDERWVDEQHPDSNAKLALTYLCRNNAKSARFVPLYNGNSSPFEAESSVNEILQDLPLPLDVAILGMGEDGHTASFFPNAATLKQALWGNKDKLCSAIEPPLAPHQRMTLTLNTLLNSGHLFLQVTGKKKREVLERALATLAEGENRQTAIEALPVCAIIHQDQCQLDIYATH